MIADGGIQAFSATSPRRSPPAPTAMLGGLFAGTDESPGEPVRQGRWSRAYQCGRWARSGAMGRPRLTDR